jgi:transcriptional regulator with GAF, ATPase, and Fis domain
VDVRVIAATNRDLEKEVKAARSARTSSTGLQVMPVPLPSLRERRGDVALLARFYITRFNGEFRKHVRGVSPAAQEPARALHLAGQRARAAQRHRARHAAGRSGAARAAGFHHAHPHRVGRALQAARRGGDLEEVERQLVVQALERANNNQTQAAELLGLNRDQVRYRMEKFGLRQSVSQGARGRATAPAAGVAAFRCLRWC